MKDRISAFECTSSAKPVQTQGKDALKPKKKKPSSKAFQEFERSGIIIGFVSTSSGTFVYLVTQELSDGYP